MQINVKLSPDVLDWVMAHIQQENVPRDVVKYLTIWKSGEKVPTFNQIEKVSKASGIPFGYFFLQEPPKEEFPLLEYRTIDSTSAMNPSRNIIDVMHDMEQVQDWARNHDIEEEQQAPEFIGSQKNNVDTEDFAEYVRTVLELEIKWYENSKSAVESFKTLRDKISQAGVIVMMSGIVGNNTHRPLDINEFRAFAMVDDLVPLIFINSNDSVNGKLFSLLHEFAHICIGNNSLYNDRYSSGTRVSKAESVSNAVAAEILVPQVMFEKKWKEIDKFDDPIKTIDVLTKYFSCGTTVIARKALDNGYIDYSVFFLSGQVDSLFETFGLTSLPVHLAIHQRSDSIFYSYCTSPIISLAMLTSSFSLVSSFSATSFPCIVIRYSFFLPSQSPQGSIHFLSCKEFNAPYKVPAPNESRPPVFSSINCMTAYPCFGV